MALFKKSSIFVCISLLLLPSLNANVGDDLKTIYDSRGDDLAYPKDIRYFSKYKCKSSGKKNYNVTIPNELSLFFSYEAKTDIEYKEILPDDPETNESIADINLKNMEKAADKATQVEDPNLTKLDELAEKLSDIIERGEDIPMKVYLEFSTLSGQVLSKYGYKQLKNFINVAIPEGKIEKQLALQGQVVFNFQSEVFQKNIELKTGGISSLHAEDLVTGWELGRTHLTSKGYPAPPKMKTNGFLSDLNLGASAYEDISLFGSEFKKIDFLGKFRAHPVTNVLHMPSFEDKPPKTFEATLYFGVYPHELSLEEVQSYKNVIQPAVANLICEQELEEDLENEAATLSWLDSLGFNLDDFYEGKYDEVTPVYDVEEEDNDELNDDEVGGEVPTYSNTSMSNSDASMSESSKLEIHQVMSNKVISNLIQSWLLLSNVQKSDLLKKVDAKIAAMDRKKMLTVGAVAAAGVWASVKMASKKLPIIGLAAIATSAQSAPRTCVGPDLASNIANLSLNELQNCLYDSPKLKREFALLMGELEDR